MKDNGEILIKLNKNLAKNLLTLINLSLPVLYLGILLKVMMVNYSNIFYWDEWDSRLIMDPKLKKLNLGTLWAQHNEHRIVWSKILSFLDFKFFNGNNSPLLITGILIAISTYILFLLYLWRLSSIKAGPARDLVTLSALVGILIFSTMQNENFLWAFQSQFFLAIFLPLVAFILGFRYVQTGNKKYFISCWFASFFSIGTIASGLLVSACLVLMFAIARLSKREILTSIILTILEFVLYFYQYETPNSSPISVFVQHPIFVLRYVAHYISFPTTYLIGGGNVVFQLLATFMFVITIVLSLMRIYKGKKLPAGTGLVPVIMATYVLGTAIISAGGRYQFGIAQSTASRYTTVSLTGWCCISILIFELFKKNSSLSFMFIPVIIGVLLLPQQTKSLSITDNQYFDRKIAAVALELNIHDDSQLQNIYPNANRLREQSKVLIENRQSIFGDQIFRKASNLLGTHLNSNFENCLGNVDVNSPIEGQISSHKLTGWIFQKSNGKIPKFILSVDPNGIVNGFGLTDMLRTDVANVVDKAAKFSGFELYTVSTPTAAIIGFDTIPFCSLKIW
jgi:hypothetical protein